MEGFKHEARTVLSGKLGTLEADQLLEKKYDLETALVIENSVTECVMQCSEMENEIVSLLFRHYETTHLYLLVGVQYISLDS